MDDTQEIDRTNELYTQQETGQQAQDFLKYLADHPYFEGLLERMRRELLREIAMLDPESTAAFRTLKTRMDCIPLIRETISAEIFLGSEAMKALSGETEQPKGLL